jgi:hypothetical protein
VNKFIIIILIIIPTIVCSQTFDLGLTMGINTSQVSGDGLGGYNKLGIRIGGLIRKEFSQFNAQIELQYINKGSSRNSPNDSYIDSYTLQLNYIEIPIIIEKRIYKHMYLQTGISIGKLVHMSELNNNYEVNGIKINNTEYSVNVGIHTKLKNNIYLNTRLSHSIFPVRPHSSEQIYKWNRGQYNTSISIALNYIIKRK